MQSEPEGECVLRTRLAELVSQTSWLMEALLTVRDLCEVPWCIGAGAIRSRVWDQLHGYSNEMPADVDVVFFDTATGADEERRISDALAKLLPSLRWDVVNQAHAHKLSGNRNATAFLSLEDALASWPETATALGLWLDQSGSLQVVAPYGLADLFNLVLRPSPRLRDSDAFAQRCQAKRWRERWPLLRLASG